MTGCECVWTRGECAESAECVVCVCSVGKAGTAFDCKS